MTDKKFLVGKIMEGSYTKEQLLGWVNALPTNPTTVTTVSLKKEPVKNKRGDVYMHPVFKHPYVLLKKRKNHWLCGSLTSEATCSEVLEKCESRFFSDEYFTKVLFTQSLPPKGSFLGTYDNGPQLTRVLTELKNILI
jgi:hypothetical protein